jgi:hypothetical protein
MENKKIESYSGKYLGIPYEIRHWHYSNGEPQWNYYLFISERQIPEVFPALWLDGTLLDTGSKSKRIFYDYSNTMIASLDWHCGCTYYEKISGFDEQDKAIKVGCDYAHLYDVGRCYSLSDIERDVIDCINSLVERVKVLQWCSYCGDYVELVDERNRCPDCKSR